MNLIDRAIEKKLHIKATLLKNEQTWDAFVAASKEKQTFLFGVGAGANYYAQYCEDKVDFVGAIDNDEKKCDFVLSDFADASVSTKYHNLPIYTLDYLKKYNSDDIAVLITSTNYYESMIDQLTEIGISNIFVLLLIEVNNPNRKVPDEVDVQKEKDAFIKLCNTLPIEKKKVILSYGAYGGHNKYITKQLLKNRSDLDIVWAVNNLEMKAPKGVRLVKIQNWKKYVYEMMTSAIWIYDVMVPTYITKREGQIYIQVKHWASITLKKFYLESGPTLRFQPALDEAVHNQSMIDYIFTGSKFDELSCESGYGVKDIFCRIGSPRTDALFMEGMKEKVCKRYGLSLEGKYLLYAPTYRESDCHSDKTFEIDLDFELLKKVLEKCFGGQWKFLVRLHPLVSNKKNSLKYTDDIINVATYEDSQELIAASDIMITDYSSIMFEPAFVKKPVFLYAPDKKAYIEKEQELLLDYDALPFPIAETNEVLERLIETFDYDKYVKGLESFFAEQEVCEDGQASMRAAKIISEMIE